jgi:hypothetical protein
VAGCDRVRSEDIGALTDPKGAARRLPISRMYHRGAKSPVNCGSTLSPRWAARPPKDCDRNCPHPIGGNELRPIAAGCYPINGS